jgi:hypothetical protein
MLFVLPMMQSIGLRVINPIILKIDKKGVINLEYWRPNL